MSTWAVIKGHVRAIKRGAQFFVSGSRSAGYAHGKEQPLFIKINSMWNEDLGRKTVTVCRWYDTIHRKS